MPVIFLALFAVLVDTGAVPGTSIWEIPVYSSCSILISARVQHTMLRLVFSTSLVFLAAATLSTLIVGSTPPPPMAQPIQFSHKLHVDYFRDGRHRQEMVSMHRERLLEEVEDEEIIGEIIGQIEQVNCRSCHGNFNKNAQNLARLGQCAECHRVFLDHDLQASNDERSCIGCHNAVVQTPWASIASTNTCAACHPLPLAGDHDEMKLFEFIEQERMISWARVYDYLPSEIVFSHERHVEFGGVKCQECHGHVERAEQPLALEVNLSMEDCMSCHEVSGADNDCMACHK
jgi:hypothetical protein